MASFIYNSFLTRQTNGNAIDLDDNSTTTIKVALTTSSYTPNQDTHDFFDDITNEVSATGYTTGGAALTTRTITQDDTNNGVKFDGDDVSWTSSDITARYAVIYKSTGTASTSALIALIDFGSNYTSVGGTFQITWNASGIITFGF